MREFWDPGDQEGAQDPGFGGDASAGQEAGGNDGGMDPGSFGAMEGDYSGTPSYSGPSTPDTGGSVDDTEAMYSGLKGPFNVGPRGMTPAQEKAAIALGWPETRAEAISRAGKMGRTEQDNLAVGTFVHSLPVIGTLTNVLGRHHPALDVKQGSTATWGDVITGSLPSKSAGTISALAARGR